MEQSYTQHIKRDSTICTFRNNGSRSFGVIQKLCVCECSPVYVALIHPFQLTNRSILSASGNPGRETLRQYAEMDLLGSFVIQVSKQLLFLIAIPISDIWTSVSKCLEKFIMLSKFLIIMNITLVTSLHYSIRIYH